MKTIIIVFKTVLFLGGLVAATAGAVILPAAMSTEGDILPIIGLIVGGGFLCAVGVAEFLQHRNLTRHDQYVTQIIQSRYE